jgi:hypothetical protein
MNNLFGLALGVFADVTRQRGALVGIGTVIVAASVLLTEWSRESAGAKRDPAEARGPAEEAWGAVRGGHR